MKKSYRCREKAHCCIKKQEVIHRTCFNRYENKKTSLYFEENNETFFEEDNECFTYNFKTRNGFRFGKL